MDSKVLGLEDASTFPRLLEELARRGWSDEELRGLAGGSFLRVLRAVEAFASVSGARPAGGGPAVPCRAGKGTGPRGAPAPPYRAE